MGRNGYGVWARDRWWWAGPAGGSAVAPMGVYADAGVFGFDLPAGVWGGYLLPLGLVALSWFGERTVGRRSRRVVCAGVGGVLAFGVSETAMGLSAVVWLVSGVASGTG